MELFPALFSIIFFAVSAVASSEPTFIIRAPNKTVEYKRSALLARKDKVRLKIKDDPAYLGREMTYEAVPVRALFEGIQVTSGAILQFRCLDGFSAPISSEKLLNESTERSTAFLAIEPKNQKWPPLSPPANEQTAGPFYLIWVNPKLSGIAREEWPYQLVGFEVKASLSTSFPHIFPDGTLPAEHPVKRGFKIFTRDCFVCHTMNLQGESKLGPDLNVPANPTEYFMPDALKLLIRDPQLLRFWPLAKMHGFSKKQLSDENIDDLITYLKHMAHKKIAAPSATEALEAHH